MPIVMEPPANVPDVALVAAIAHDRRTPLTVVLANAQLLRRQARRVDAVPSAWLDTGLSEIEAAGQRIAQLIDEIVDLARSQAGDSPLLGRYPTDLAGLVARVAAEVPAASGQQRIRLQFAESSPIGLWDTAGLRRVLENLLGNALKYSPPDREVVVGVAREVRGDGDWAVLVVRDQGRGIPAADLPHIFEPFRRGANVGSVDGSGLGLAGAKQLVAAHGGSITVESVDGAGATVTVRLPYA